MKIHAPNEKYNGITAGIQFVDGVAEVEETKHIEWLKSKGYKIEIEKKKNKKKEG